MASVTPKAGLSLHQNYYERVHSLVLIAVLHFLNGPPRTHLGDFSLGHLCSRRKEVKGPRPVGAISDLEPPFAVVQKPDAKASNGWISKFGL